MWNKHVIHLPSLPLLCLMLSCRILLNPTLWVDCLLLVCFWLQQHHSEFSFSKTAFIWQHHDIYHKSREQVLFAALPRSWNSPPCNCEQFCPELMRFLTCLRIPRIKPLSLGRFSKIISNSLNHHGSRKRDRVLLSKRIYRLEARVQGKIPSSLPSSISTSERSCRK